MRRIVYLFGGFLVGGASLVCISGIPAWTTEIGAAMSYWRYYGSYMVLPLTGINIAACCIFLALWGRDKDLRSEVVLWDAGIYFVAYAIAVAIWPDILLPLWMFLNLCAAALVWMSFVLPALYDRCLAAAPEAQVL